MAFNFTYQVPQFVTGPLTTAASMYGNWVNSQSAQNEADNQYDLMKAQQDQNRVNALFGAAGDVGSGYFNAQTLKKTKAEDQNWAMEMLRNRMAGRETGIPNWQGLSDQGFAKLNTMPIAEQNKIAGQWGMTAANPNLGYMVAKHDIQQGVVGQDLQNQLTARQALSNQDRTQGALAERYNQNLYQFGDGLTGTHILPPPAQKRYDANREAFNTAIEAAPQAERLELTRNRDAALADIVGHAQLTPRQAPPKDFNQYLQSVGGHRVTAPDGSPTDYIATPNRKTGKTEYQEIKPRKKAARASTPAETARLDLGTPKMHAAALGDTKPIAPYEGSYPFESFDASGAWKSTYTGLVMFPEYGFSMLYEPGKDGEEGKWVQKDLDLPEDEQPDTMKAGNIRLPGLATPISVSDFLELKKYAKESVVTQKLKNPGDPDSITDVPGTPAEEKAALDKLIAEMSQAEPPLDDPYSEASRRRDAAVQLSPSEEAEFQKWYAGQVERRRMLIAKGATLPDVGPLNPDPDDPRHFYDYRGAWKAGVEQGENGHWPSQFKADNHPNRFVGGVDTRAQIPATQPAVQPGTMPPMPPKIQPGPAQLPNAVDLLGGWNNLTSEQRVVRIKAGIKQLTAIDAKRDLTQNEIQFLHTLKRLLLDEKKRG